MKEKVLILSGNYGDGHQQAANAIQQALRLTRPEVETIVLDFMEWTYPYVNPISRYFFIQGVKKFPKVYGYLYKKTKNDNSLSVVLKKFNRLGIGRLFKLLRVVQPTVVVSTFPLSSGAMSVLKGYGLVDTPMITVITDHTDHSYWVHPYTDHYIVGSHIVKKGLNEYHIPNKKISVTGIPIRPEFSQPFERDALMSKHGLDPHLPTIMMMGGGSGIISEGLSNLNAFESITQKLQIIIICGHNEKLKQHIEERVKYSKHRVIVTGYINYVHELMAVSDLMITKPGGLTTAEAIASELPMLLFNPLPGQEQDNARFLLKAGVARTANNLEELISLLARILDQPSLIQQMKKNGRMLAQKQTAFDAAKVIMNISNECSRNIKENLTYTLQK